MQTYTVIWRNNCDEFMVTEVRTTDDPADVPSIGWVQTAAAVEYDEWDEVDRIAAIADLLTGRFELIGVFKGEGEWVA